MRVSVRPLLGVAALVIGISSGFTAPVGAAPASPVSCTGNGPFTAGMLDVSCVIDAHLTAIHVVAVGAPGGEYNAQTPGGKGAVVTADLVLPAGTTLFVNVGGAGKSGPAPTGGANGGGDGQPDPAHSGAGGGGASDVRMPTNAITDRVLVAGGGGGGGESAQSPAAFAGANADGGSGGLIIGGTSAAGSVAGKGGGEGNCVGRDGGGTQANAADPTPPGDGGLGLGEAAGGGGGGYAGGGGGGAAMCDVANSGGGGGGSSLVPMGGTRATDTTGTPMITITAPVPAASSGPTISGSTVVGQTLTESHAPWSNTPTAIALQWLRCDTSGIDCEPIGTPAATYTLTADDAGHTFKAQETATNFYGSSLALGAAGTVTSAATAVVTAVTIPPPTITAKSTACQQLDATVTNNNTAGSAVQYTVTATSGSRSVSRMTDGTAQPGQSSSVHISRLPVGGTYKVTANGGDGSVSAQPTTVKVKECVINHFKAKIGTGHFAHSFAKVKLINRHSNVAVPVTVVAVHHSSHKYTVKPHEVRTVEAFIASHGHSKIKVVDAAGVEAKRKFFGN